MKMIQKVLLNGILVVLPLQLCAMQKPAATVDEFEAALAAQDAGEQTQSRAWNLVQYIPSWMTGRRAKIAGATALGLGALAVGGTIGYKQLKAKYDTDNDFKGKVDAFGAGVKNHKGKIIGGAVGAVALTGLAIAGYKWWTSRARKAELLDLMKQTVGEDEAVEAVPAWVDGLDALLTIVATESNVEDAHTWKTDILKKAIAEKSPYFLVNDPTFVARMKQADYKMGLIELIGQAEAELRLELASLIIAAHDDNEAVAATLNDEFFTAVMINPAVLLEEPFKAVLTREERGQINLAVDIQAKKAKRIARYIEEQGLQPVLELEAAY